MKIVLPAGTYVVAVSGGVDSMALLHMLVEQCQVPDYRFVVAHFDHGIRTDSGEDHMLVRSVAGQYNLPFVYDEGHLGASTSEAVARTARYKFLHTVRVAAKAQAIITAHHQDDMLETAIINMLRGTGRRGLSSLQSRDMLLRPLLSMNKTDIMQYARRHKLQWREDFTNADETYLRNYVRRHIVPKFTSDQKTTLLSLIETTKELNASIEDTLQDQLGIATKSQKIDRQWFSGLSHQVASEVMMSWLREKGISTYDKKTIERLVVAAKTAAPNKSIDIVKGASMLVQDRYLTIQQNTL